MVNRFNVNGVTYTAKPFSFMTMVNLNKAGIPLAKFGTMELALINAYFAICADLDEEEAAKEIEAHVINGGELSDISNAMSKEMEESDFFRSISSRAQKNERENPAENPTEIATATEKSKRGRKPKDE